MAGRKREEEREVFPLPETLYGSSACESDGTLEGGRCAPAVACPCFCVSLFYLLQGR